MTGESPRHPPGLTPEDDDAEDLYHHAPCGYLTTDADGRILRANATLARWLGRTTAELASMTFVELLTPGGRIYHETHFAPS
uniref:PAS domain-containing protein n=1 Tax=uncultured Nocardioides sp. TaxID=198441 RepID=UPI0030FCA628